MASLMTTIGRVDIQKGILSSSQFLKSASSSQHPQHMSWHCQLLRWEYLYLSLLSCVYLHLATSTSLENHTYSHKWSQKETVSNIPATFSALSLWHQSQLELHNYLQKSRGKHDHVPSFIIIVHTSNEVPDIWSWGSYWLIMKTPSQN